MINVGIIGCGFVGGAFKDWLEHNNPECKLFVAIKAELASANPRPLTLKNTFKAIAWGALVACKATIEEFIEKTINLIE